MENGNNALLTSKLAGEGWNGGLTDLLRWGPSGLMEREAWGLDHLVMA